jgi:hypothetical protein
LRALQKELNKTLLVTYMPLISLGVIDLVK